MGILQRRKSLSQHSLFASCGATSNQCGQFDSRLPTGSTNPVWPRGIALREETLPESDSARQGLLFRADTAQVDGIAKMLTERQEAMLDFIRRYQKEEQVPPSTRIIQRHFGLSAHSTVAQHLRALAHKGQLEQLADGRWGLKTSAVQGQLFDVPIFGSIPAGLPTLEEQEAEEKIAIDPALFGIRRPRPGRLWALRVRGDSMIGAHILDGDLVLMEWREPRVGEIIAALVDETTTTLKRVVREKGRILLRAANPRYPDLAPSRLEAQGVVLGVIRRKLPELHAHPCPTRPSPPCGPSWTPAFRLPCGNRMAEC